MNNLPNPSIPEQQYSQALIDIIKQEKVLSFKDYMQLALYHPQYGYYSATMHKFGEKGDFVTAPEISSLFGETVANYYVKHSEKYQNPSILEFGAGTGKLAADILCALQAQNKLPQYYYIVEVSADLRARQQQYLQQQLAPYFNNIIWLDKLPDSFSGLVIANEVLDAMPVHKFQIDQQGDISEFYVKNDGEKFIWHLDKVDNQQLVETIRQLNIDVEHDSYISEINLMIKPWLQSIADFISQGEVLLIDYGYLQHEYYHPDRYMGTLMCHYKHRAHSDPLILTGLQDITAHVDFTAVMQAAEQVGFRVEGYSNQAGFLLDNGIAQLAEQQLQSDDLQKMLTISQQLQTLTMPHEMGELFKVVVLAK